MKELSIEQKAQRYNEALKRAMRLYEQGTITESLSYVFPELKDSEDERTRKYLISFVKLNSGVNLPPEDAEQILAWLEKQGQVKESTISHEEDERIRKGIIRNLEYLADRAEGFVKDELKERITWLEKQVEQKPYGQRQECADCQFNYAGECKGSCAMKRGEQNHTDKVEPKFKKGDWITDGYLHYKITDVLEDRYIVDTKFVKRSAILFNNESRYHLWTIQDAKDGDVLAESKGDVILMFRGIGNTRWDDVIDYHFYYDCYRENFIVQEDVNYWGNTENNQLKPATKEQRDLLFQKMRESGYEWDAEEKELKEIEQKFTDNDMKEALRTEYEKGRADAIAKFQKAWSK